MSERGLSNRPDTSKKESEERDYVVYDGQNILVDTERGPAWATVKLSFVATQQTEKHQRFRGMQYFQSTGPFRVEYHRHRGQEWDKPAFTKFWGFKKNYRLVPKNR